MISGNPKEQWKNSMSIRVIMSNAAEPRDKK